MTSVKTRYETAFFRVVGSYRLRPLWSPSFGIVAGPATLKEVVLHYYQFNIADYRKKTHYLSHLEHGIYRSLIDSYYMEEGPLCGDKAKLMRTHNIRTNEEKTAFNLVLEDFFYLIDDGYHNDKCDEELAKIYEKSEKARQSAMRRWEKKAKAMRTHCEGNADGMLPNTLLPKHPKPISLSLDGAKTLKESGWQYGDQQEQIIRYHRPDLINNGFLIAEKFRVHFEATGEQLPDWDARWEKWVLDERDAR